MDFLSIGLGAGAAALQNRWNKQAEKRQYERNVKMMGIQTDNQMRLNRQGADLSYENWQRTSYPAQLAMMKAAGLSPGLMYGQGGGQGGTTVGSSGSASGSGVTQGKFDIANALQAAQLASNIDLTKAMTKKTEAEAENVSTVDRELKSKQIEEIDTGIGNKYAERRLTNLKSEFQEIENDIASSTKGMRIDYVGNELIKMQGEALSALMQGNVDQATFMDKVRIVQGEAVGIYVENMLKRSNISKNEQEIEKMKNDISQAWVRLAFEKEGLILQGRSVSAQERANVIKQFEAEIKAEYPNIWNTFGKGMNDLGRWLDDLVKDTFIEDFMKDKPRKVD